MASLRTGIVIVTLLVKHICRVLAIYRPAINGLIAAAVTSSTITSVQAGILNTWLDGAQTSCDIIREISGY